MLKFGNTFVNFGGSYLSGYKVPTYNVILQQSEGGIIGASPMTGNRNTEVTLSNTPSQNYLFDGYEISGANLYETNKFKFVDSDVTAMAKWTYDWPDPNPLNLPKYTMRVKCYSGTVLSSRNTNRYTLNKVNTINGCNIYDITSKIGSWEGLGGGCSMTYPEDYTIPAGVSDILGVNNSSITSVRNMFAQLSDFDYRIFNSLSSICYFDMSEVVDATLWFYNFDNTILSAIPRFNTSAVTSFSNAFGEADFIFPFTLDCSNCVDLSDLINPSYYYASSFPTLKNTSNVTSWNGTFRGVGSRKSFSSTTIPDYDFSNAVDVTNTFMNNQYLIGGISSTYAKLSALGNQITAHSACFRNCGVSSEQGRAELALIPNDWK